MCCSIGEEEVEFAGTKIYVGEAMRDTEYVHVLAYQNKAISKFPNAMVLPIPTDVEMGLKTVP